jgi:V8-like Glu-specific endopeptidase
MKQIFVGSTQRTKLYSEIRKAIMPTRICLIAILLLLVAIPFAFQKKIFQDSAGSYCAVAYVQTYTGTGSAIHIGNNLLLSAAHVYEGMQIGDKCTIEFQDPNNATGGVKLTAEAELVALGDYYKNESPEEDFALLKVQLIDASKYAQIYSINNNLSSIRVGDDITVEGYGGGAYMQTSGKLCNITGGTTELKNLYVADAKAWHGNSGGALLDKNKQVIGIVIAGGILQGYNDGQTYALKIDKVINTLRSKGFQL